MRKARALLDGRSVASPDDVTAVALPVLRHRVLLNFQAEADASTPTPSSRGLLADVRPVTVTLDPVVLSAIHDLELVARVTVEGALSGLHRSPFHGYSAEFNQYRHYRAGDDLKYVDWKLFARTDRVYTKQFRETTNVRVQLVLDASGSMAHRGAAGASKFDYATPHRRGALRTSSSARETPQGWSSTTRRSEPTSARAAAAGTSVAACRRSRATVPEGRTASAGALRRAVDLLTSRGILIVISAPVRRRGRCGRRTAARVANRP